MEALTERAVEDVSDPAIAPGSGRLTVVVANDFAHVNGGAAQVALSSAAGLAGRGHRVVFFAAVPPIQEDLPRSGVQVVLTNQFDIKSDPSRLRAATQGVWNQRAAAELRRTLAGLNPDETVLHVHGWTKALTSSIIHAAIAQGVSVAVTLHDYFVACPNGGFFNFQEKQACHLTPLSAACVMKNCDRDGYAQKLWRVARQAVQNKFGFSASPLLTFITISDFSEDVLRPFFPAGATVYRVASPSDFAKVPPIDVGLNSAFVSAGRLSPEKGLELLAHAAMGLCDVKFIGEGPSRAGIAAANPSAQITGWQTRDQLKANLREARCLVLPSLWYEAQPMVIAEAAAMGIPSIVADQCAGREMLEDGVTGFLFRSGDHRDLRAKMMLMQDSQTAQRLGQAAYDRHWRNPFTLDRHLDALENCYRKILAQRKEPRITAALEMAR